LLKNAQQKPALLYYTPQARLPFWLLKPVFENEHVRLLPRLSWIWTLLLSSGTHRQFITSITAVLFPSVTCLLTLPRISDLPTSVIDPTCSSPRLSLGVESSLFRAVTNSSFYWFAPGSWVR
jgi:hypothetical protein